MALLSIFLYQFTLHFDVPSYYSTCLYKPVKKSFCLESKMRKSEREFEIPGTYQEKQTAAERIPAVRQISAALDCSDSTLQAYLYGLNDRRSSQRYLPPRRICGFRLCAASGVRIRIRIPVYSSCGCLPTMCRRLRDCQSGKVDPTLPRP